jgi:peptidoglycan hydrolase-like protein with peptidoglycan-binding domain
MENQAPLQPRRYKDAYPVDINKVRESLPKPATAAVVSGKEVDDVSLAAMVYKNQLNKKSLSVHHLQRRLNELGFTSAFLDKDGWLGDGTKIAIEDFRKSKNLPEVGLIDAETLKLLFEGDAGVNLIP